MKATGETRTCHICLPWPDKELSPNAHLHWRSKIEYQVAATSTGYLLVLEKYGNQPGNFAGDLALTLTFYPPDRRRRDMDNLLSSFKHHIDGICQAAGADDSQIKRIVLEWGDVVVGGMVDLSLKVLS